MSEDRVSQGESRLERIGEILLTTVSMTQQSRKDIVTLTQAIKTNTGNINRLSERLNQFVTQAELDRELLRSEIRGVRTEITRIVEYLFGQQNP
jgi:DNA invertase Pin-like site-specific DNA recombinase